LYKKEAVFSVCFFERSRSVSTVVVQYCRDYAYRSRDKT
jgi:hypothetical protein